MDAPHLIVAGTPSLDRIEIRGRSFDSIGGSGFITALAARVSGASVGLIARVPPTLPQPIAAAFAPGCIDPGGLVIADGPLPGFHITYDEDESATYVEIQSGSEASVDASDMPRRWLGARWAHIGPLAASTALQLRFVRGLLDRGFEGCLSAGTFSRAASNEPELVRRLFDLVDVAFLNREEAALVYDGSMPEHTSVCVTEGRSGARIWDGSTWRHHAAATVETIDPTGAGDAFVGGYVAAALGHSSDPLQTGVATASTIVQGPGAAPLLGRLSTRATVVLDPVHPDNGAVTIDEARIGAVGARLGDVAGSSALTFCGAPFPERNEPLALDILALATLHQYGFWYDSSHGYAGPMWATIGGVQRKGSDFIWAAFTAWATSDPEALDHSRLASDPLLFDRICVDDDGDCPVPDVGSHRVLQQGYGAAVADLGGFKAVLDQSNLSADPLATFLESLRVIPGYGEDPLAKKANLLALILASRPERFLRLRGPTEIGPIVDYHIMRTTLRMGCVDLTDEDLRRANTEREWVMSDSETAIRAAAREAIDGLCVASSLSVGAVDGFLFSLGRTICLETEAPRCGECPVAAVCARRTDLFQPIYRSTAY